MGHFINIKHLVALILTTWKNKHITVLKRAQTHCLSLENECNQHTIKAELSLLSGPGLGEKKAGGLFTDVF